MYKNARYFLSDNVEINVCFGQCTISDFHHIFIYSVSK